MPYGRIIVEIIAALCMAGGLYGLYVAIIKHGTPFGPRALQLLALTFGLPLILILGLEGRIGNEASATLIGVVIGYTLSGFGKSE